MILRKEKGKKKHGASNDNPEENSDQEEKYLAYKKKSSKKNLKKKGDETESTEELEISKKKLKITSNEEDPVATTTKVEKDKVVITAKPKLNKNALKSTVDRIDKKIQNSKKSFRLLREGDKVSKHTDDESNIEVIVPDVSLVPNMDDNELTSSQSSDSLVETSIHVEADPEVVPIIVEAHLKKTTNSYIPETLKDQTTDAEKKKKENSQSTDESIIPKIDIPLALQEFYEEVTRGFDSLTGKLSKSKKKDIKKSALTIDESVKDPINLINIVQRNTNLLKDSTLESSAKFFSLESKVILVLQPRTQFSFLGKIKLQILYGAVELYGCKFNPANTSEPIEIFSPRGYSSISISTSNVNDSNDKEALWDALTTEGVDRSLKTKLHNAIQECQPGWCVLLMENFENTLTNFLNTYCTFKLFPKIEQKKFPWCDPRRAECVLQSNFQFHSSGDEISICPQWNETVIKQLLAQWTTKKSLSTIIAGGKSVGKSTTARYLINNLLRHSKKVILLDLDPGQAEMTPAGCISLNILDKPLLGPNFTHLNMPFHQLYLEDVNVTNCITRYIECVRKLVQCLKSRKDLLQYPIIVNTMGFCKGVGLDICIFLIKLLEPDSVVQILSKRPKNNFDFALLKQTVNDRKTSSIFLEEDKAVLEKTCDYELHYVPSMAEGKRQFETWNMEPRQQRELVLLSYLSHILKNADDKSFCNLASSNINNIKPYTIPFSSVYITLIKSNISPTHILAAMNGNIVALCGMDTEEENSEISKDVLMYPLVVIKPPICTCYGYGIVRGIDMQRRQIYINTPLTESELRHVNLLAGCSPVPFSLLHSGERQPYSGDRGELPTSREAKRGYFRIDQNRTN